MTPKEQITMAVGLKLDFKIPCKYVSLAEITISLYRESLKFYQSGGDRISPIDRLQIHARAPGRRQEPSYPA